MLQALLCAIVAPAAGSSRAWPAPTCSVHYFAQLRRQLRVLFAGMARSYMFRALFCSIAVPVAGSLRGHGPLLRVLCIILLNCGASCGFSSRAWPAPTCSVHYFAQLRCQLRVLFVGMARSYVFCALFCSIAVPAVGSLRGHGPLLRVLCIILLNCGASCGFSSRAWPAPTCSAF